MNGSVPFRFTQDDLIRVAKGAALAAGGAVVAFLATEVVPNLDDSTAVGAVIAAVASTGLNALRQWLSDTRRAV